VDAPATKYEAALDGQLNSWHTVPVSVNWAALHEVDEDDGGYRV